MAGALTVRPGSEAMGQRWQVDIGGTRVGYDTSSALASAVLAPAVEWSDATTYVLVSSGLAAFEGAQWTAQGRGDVSLLFNPAGGRSPVRVELTGTAGGSVHSSAYRTATTRGELRLHVGRRGVGAWVGGHAATGWTTDTGAIASALGPTVGAWGRSGPWNALAVWAPFRFDGAWFPEVNGRISVSLRHVDVVAHVGWRGAPASSGLEATSWGGGSLALWLTPQLAVVAAAGSYPLEPLQALPRGRYLSASIRLATRRPSVWTTPTTGRAVYAAERGESALRFAVPGATRVAVVGDWTFWQPVPLQREPGGRWVMRVTLAPGVYRFNLVVDGTRWIVPEGVAAVDDGFGGTIALLVVP